jgi:Cd2+/Zn2+-exporting ATPase
MKLPIQDNKFLFLSAVTIVIVRNFIDNWFRHSNALCAFYFRLICHWYWPHRFAKWRKTIFKLKFSSINLLMTIAVVAAFYLGEYPGSSCIVLYVLGERLEDIGLENSKSALDQLVNRAPKRLLSN